jgi:hypothetical protein
VIVRMGLDLDVIEAIERRAAASGRTFELESGRLIVLGALAELVKANSRVLFPEKSEGRELSPPATISDPPRQAVLDAPSASILPPAGLKVQAGGDGPAA